MPKNRVVTKSQTGAITRSRPPHKLRIGTRKSGRTALRMTNDELREVLTKVDMARYHQKARNVLADRGVEVDWHAPKLVA